MEPPGLTQYRCVASSSSSNRSIAVLQFLAASLLVGGCAATPREVTEGRWSEASHDDRYPYSEIEKIYDTVLTTMLPRYFGDDLELGRKHQQALEAFVRSTFPPARFSELMVPPGNTRNLFDQAQHEPAARDTAEFQRAFEVTVNVSVQMAMIIFAGRFDTYGAKFLHPTETTDYLFSLTSDTDEEGYISWVSGEVSLDEARKELGDTVDCRAGDRFFLFSSPEWYWQQLAGRQGYLQVRDDRIIGSHITILN
jgi:hypothetical protein